MRKNLVVFLVFLATLIISCEGDDDFMGNLPPTEVTNIDAQTIDGTIVKVSWKASEDVNNDKISYNVVVNDVVIANKTPETFVEFDAVQFLSVTKSNKMGVNLELVIKIESYDTNGGVSDEVQISRNVFVNREPGEFSFNYINFDLYNYNWIDIAWSPSSDEDGDIVSYDIYFNELLIKEAYIISSDSYQGEFNYYEDFREFINQEFVIKIIANDRSGGVKEISESYNFRATDIDLGELTVPYNDSFQFDIESNEPDKKVGYSFRINQETGYSFKTDSNVTFNLYTNTGEFINNGYSGYISGISLPSGSYYLEVINDYYYDSQGISGSVLIDFRDPNISDVDLGELTIPYNDFLPFEIEIGEPDKKIKYTFSIDQETGYSFSTESNVYFDLYNSTGNYINSGYGNLTGESLQVGSYYLEVTNNSYNGEYISGTIAINLRDFRESDIDLGMLSVPYNDSLTFEILSDEVDKKIGYSFTIDQETGYSFSTESDVYLNLYTSNGSYINSNYREIYDTSLQAGSYYLEVVNNSYYNQGVSGLITINFLDPKATDVDLGILSVPYNDTLLFEIQSEEVDRKIGYTFSIQEETGYLFITETGVDFNLYNEYGNYVNSGYNLISGESLPAGSYYLEVINYSYYGQDINGSIAISFSDPNASDIDLGVLSVPYNDSFSFEINAYEPDGSVKYSFNTDQEASYMFSVTSYVSYDLYTESGQYINGGNVEISGQALPAGSYYLIVYNDPYTSVNTNGTFSISLQ